MSDDSADDTPVPYDEPSGLWVAILQDAGVLEIKLNGEAGILRNCEIIQVDAGAMLVAKKDRDGNGVETLLIPTGSINHVKIKPDKRLSGAFARAMSGQ